jgi:hypothetical protein
MVQKIIIDVQDFKIANNEFVSKEVNAIVFRLNLLFRIIYY